VVREIDVGARVHTEGMDQRPELNHRTGTVIDRRSFGRWTVALDDGSEQVAFKDENLRRVDAWGDVLRRAHHSAAQRSDLSYMF